MTQTAMVFDTEKMQNLRIATKKPLRKSPKTLPPRAILFGSFALSSGALQTCQTKPPEISVGHKRGLNSATESGLHLRGSSVPRCKSLGLPWGLVVLRGSFRVLVFEKQNSFNLLILGPDLEASLVFL